ncbi:hypothetical protein DLJ49_16760 [Rhodovulum sp. 12E13]|uniref:hypothetical protein n=1 Tax=Rhodovulum sp. 12E13 TaxID=2203891 RepID=UPI000E17E919|nr:hypothetical protein [Rhodovulum sp. 12E13]RDC70949.1 hypothetical protein DLJ49_16760 [Rhodovulum sp. 12E13]
MLERDLIETNAALAALMREKLGIRRGATLAAKLRIAGRLLPKAERKAGRTLVEAEQLWANPKLRRRLDPAALAAAEARLRGFLDRIDPADRRKGMILGILASLAFNFMLIAAAAIVWAWHTGRI